MAEDNFYRDSVSSQAHSTKTCSNEDKGYETVSTESRVLVCVASALGMCVFCVLSALLVVLQVTDAAHCMSLLASVMALSVVWSQPVRRYVTGSDATEALRQNVTLLQAAIRVLATAAFCVLTTVVGDGSGKVGNVHL
jgi:hypothetical protein